MATTAGMIRVGRSGPRGSGARETARKKLRSYFDKGTIRILKPMHKQLK